MMTFDEAVAETKTLKQLERVKGTGGAKDYFCLLTTDKAKFCLKVDFIRTITGQPVAFFARVRVVTSKDIGNIEKDLNDGVFGDRKKLEKTISKKPIKATNLKSGKTRLSYILESKMALNDYGNIAEDYDGVIDALRSDLASIGNRVFDSIKAFYPEASEQQRIMIQGCMRDYCGMFKPHKPDDSAGGGDKVVPIK